MSGWIKKAITRLKGRRSSSVTSVAKEIREQKQEEAIARPIATVVHSAPRSVNTKVALQIGFDFGTHSTKVVVRRRGERAGHVIRMDDSVEGYPPYVVPSLVRTSDGVLFFGGEALNHSAGTLHRLLKLDLISLKSESRTADGQTELLVAGYFGWVLNAVRDWIEKEYGLQNSKLFLNVAAPMDHYEDIRIKSRYLKILNTAWDWSFGDDRKVVSQGISKHLLAKWMPKIDTPVPEPSVRSYDVLPETIAPIVSLSQDPKMHAGMYLLVDVGAGTTEMSVNYVSVPGGNQNVLCYFDRSIVLGAEQLQTIQDPAQLISTLLKNLWQTWCHGYEKDASNYAARLRWKSLRILLLGGGTCRDDVRGAIGAERHAVYSRFPGEATCDVLRHGPADLLFEGKKIVAENGSLLSVANGLAFPRMQWPKFYEPAMVKAIGATAVQAVSEAWYLDR